MDKEREDLIALTDKVFTHMSLILRPDKIEYLMHGKEVDHKLVFRFEGNYKERDILQRQFVAIINAYAESILGYYTGSDHPFYVVLRDFDNAFARYIKEMNEKGYNVQFVQEDKEQTAEIHVSRIINVDPLKVMGF